MLTIAPCIGTDQMGPKRFGALGKLAFSYGNVAQDEGAAMAEYAYNVKHWKTAITVTDNLLVYFKNVVQAFTSRFKQLGGKIVDAESFTSFDKTIGNVVSRVNAQKADVIVTSTGFAGLAGVHGRHPQPEQQHADHELVGRRRHVLVPEEPGGLELLVRDLRLGVRRRPERRR